MTFFARKAKFLLAGMRAQYDEGAGRILLGDNSVVMLWPIRFQCAGVWI